MFGQFYKMADLIQLTNNNLENLHCGIIVKGYRDTESKHGRFFLAGYRSIFFTMLRQVSGLFFVRLVTELIRTDFSPD